jgi:hypothetical protein
VDGLRQQGAVLRTAILIRRAGEVAESLRSYRIAEGIGLKSPVENASSQLASVVNLRHPQGEEERPLPNPSPCGINGLRRLRLYGRDLR